MGALANAIADHLSFDFTPAKKEDDEEVERLSKTDKHPNAHSHCDPPKIVGRPRYDFYLSHFYIFAAGFANSTVRCTL